MKEVYNNLVKRETCWQIPSRGVGEGRAMFHKKLSMVLYKLHPSFSFVIQALACAQSTHTGFSSTCTLKVHLMPYACDSDSPVMNERQSSKASGLISSICTLWIERSPSQVCLVDRKAKDDETRQWFETLFTGKPLC